MMTIDDLKKLSLADLNRLKEDVQTAREFVLERDKQDVFDYLAKQAEERGFKLVDLVSSQVPDIGAGKVRKKAEPKYRHPQDASKTWAGRGTKPVWVRDHLENGGKLEDLAI